MEKKLQEIYEKNINNNFVLDKDGVIKSMEESYELGSKEVLDWLSEMDYLSDNINYIIEEWNNINKKSCQTKN
jgi:hypothetical protein